MSPSVARPLLHTVHLLTFAVALATGVLLFVPDLRALITGGYSLLIRQAHLWSGVAFALLPVVLIAVAGARNIFVAPAARTLRTYWQGAHFIITVLASVVFVLTGVVLWAKRVVPESILDRSRDAHDWLTYAVAVLVAVHLCEVGMAALIARIKTGAVP